MNTIEKIQEFIENINSNYFWREQFQAFAFTFSYAVMGLHQFISL